MGDYVRLLGTEDVRQAGHNIAHGGAEMLRAAGLIESMVLQRQRDESAFLDRLEMILLEDRRARGIEKP